MTAEVSPEKVLSINEVYQEVEEGASDLTQVVEEDSHENHIVK